MSKKAQRKHRKQAAGTDKIKKTGKSERTGSERQLSGLPDLPV
ncbi:hypothetical protein [Cerasicoccus fimbriatus]|nr:hypothetical protein [Cerasicoccus sp. TK19100]